MAIKIEPPAGGGGGGGAVTSVNTKIGAVVLDTDDILEPGGATNEWFTAPRALAAVPSIQDKTNYVNVTSADIQAGINAVATTNEAVIVSPGTFNSSGVVVSVNNKDYLNIKSVGGVENSPNAFIGDGATLRGLELTGTTNKCRINGFGIYGPVTLNAATGGGVANNRFHNCHMYGAVTVANAGASPLSSFVAFYDCEFNADVTINVGVTGLVLFVRCLFVGGSKIINSTGVAAKSIYLVSECTNVHADNVSSALNREVTLLNTNTEAGQTLPQLDAGPINCTSLGSIALHSDVGAVGVPNAGDVYAWDGVSSFTVQAQSGGGALPLSTYTTTTTHVSPAAAGSSYLVDITGAPGPLTVLLPAAPVAGDQIEVTKEGAAHSISINGNGKLIGGAATISLNAAGASTRLRYWDAVYQWREMS